MKTQKHVVLTKYALHLFTLFDLIHILSLECVHIRIELKQGEEMV